MLYINEITPHNGEGMNYELVTDEGAVLLKSLWLDVVEAAVAMKEDFLIRPFFTSGFTTHELEVSRIYPNIYAYSEKDGEVWEGTGRLLDAIHNAWDRVVESGTDKNILVSIG